MIDVQDTKINNTTQELVEDYIVLFTDHIQMEKNTFMSTYYHP